MAHMIQRGSEGELRASLQQSLARSLSSMSEHEARAIGEHVATGHAPTAMPPPHTQALLGL